MTLAVNYIAPADHTGYACAAAGYMQLLREAGIDVRFQPLCAGAGLGLWYECSHSGDALIPDAITVLHAVPEYYAPLKEWLQSRGIRGPIVGMTVWETDRIPGHWPVMLNGLDAVIVPSDWNRRVFRECDVCVPIFAIPHVSQFNGIGADKTSVQSLQSRLPGLKDKFVFYSIGAWSHRKGNDLLIRAFQKAFADRDDVALVLKTSATSFDAPSSRWIRTLQRLAGVTNLHRELIQGKIDGVFAITEDLSDDEIRALHTIGDCYVSCARGEGWALGLYEAIFFGKPVFAPWEGGHREYLRSETFEGLLAGKATNVRTPGRNTSYRSDQKWFEVDIEQAARKMRHFFDHPAILRHAGKQLAVEVRLRLSREPIQTALLEALTGIHKIRRPLYFPE